MVKGDVSISADLDLGVVIMDIKITNKMFPEGVSLPLGLMPFSALTVAKLIVEQAILILEPKGTLPE